MSGLLLSSSQNTAPSMHDLTHVPQPVHFSAFSSTPPPFRNISASSGQERAHGGSSHALQVVKRKPCCIPPADFTPRQLLARPASLWMRVHANMQHWQPTHLSASRTSSLTFFSLLTSLASYSISRKIPTSHAEVQYLHIYSVYHVLAIC
jgi:hypothetical protein